MTTQAKTFYYATCDAPGCDAETRNDNNQVYDDISKLDEQFVPRRFMEGGLEDDYGWMHVDDKHYCGEHTTWDDDNDERVPDPDGTLRAAELAAYAARRPDTKDSHA